MTNTCKGMNCTYSPPDCMEHSMECEAEHSAAIAGGRFVKAGATSNIMQLAGRWRTANYAEREECRVDLEAAVNAQSAEINDLRTALAERDAEVQTTLERLAASQREAIALRTAAQQALEMLETHCGNYKLDDAGCERHAATIAALTAALESK